MVSILPAEKGLYPWAVTISAPEPLSLQGLCSGMRVGMDSTGLWVNEAGYAVDFSSATLHSLDILAQVSGEADALASMARLTSFLQKEGSPEGMLPLAVGGEDTPYSAMVRPKLGELHKAFHAMDGKAAARAAAALAGCGPGLTPSSDDMLLGYVCAFYALKNQAGQARETLLSLGRSACEAAAEKTNRISGSFLRQCGNGLASQSILELLAVLFSGAPIQQIEAKAREMLNIGATSGADILTGIVLSLQTHGRGEDIGKNRSSQERVL